MPGQQGVISPHPGFGWLVCFLMWALNLGLYCMLNHSSSLLTMYFKSSLLKASSGINGFAIKPKDLFDHWDLHGGKRTPSPTSCLLTYTSLL